MENRSKEMIIVENINSNIWNFENEELNNLIKEYGNLLEIHSDGYEYKITFLSFDIYSSDDDERPYIDEKDDYMNLEQFIILQIKDIVNKIKILNECNF